MVLMSSLCLISQWLQPILLHNKGQGRTECVHRQDKKDDKGSTTNEAADGGVLQKPAQLLFAWPGLTSKVIPKTGALQPPCTGLVIEGGVPG